MLECAGAIQAELEANGLEVIIDTWDNHGPCWRVDIRDHEHLYLRGGVYGSKARALIKSAARWATEYPRAKARSEQPNLCAHWRSEGLHW